MTNDELILPGDVEIKAYRDPAWRGVALYVYKRAFEPGQTEARGQFVFDPFDPRTEPMTYVPPAARLNDLDAQALMDSLWDAGLRPTQGHGTAGQLSATQAHLNDLRAIAAAKLKVSLPQK